MKKNFLIGFTATSLILTGIGGVNLCKNTRSPEEHTSVSENRIKNDIPVFNLDNSTSQDTKIQSLVTAPLEDELEEVIDELYQEMPEETLNELEQMDGQELEEEIEGINQKYTEGDILSDEDQNTIVYITKQVNENEVKDDGITEVYNVKRSYKVSNSKSKYNTKVACTGKIFTKAYRTSGYFGGDINVSIKSGKKNIKKIRTQVHHRVYGLIGMNGKTPSLGCIYSGSVSTGWRTSGFNISKTKKYGGILPVYCSSWASVEVNAKKGVYSFNTKTFSAWE